MQGIKYKNSTKYVSDSGSKYEKAHMPAAANNEGIIFLIIDKGVYLTK